MNLDWDELSALSIDQLPNDKIGIYIYTKPWLGFESIVYVGKTEQGFYDRHSQHCSDQETNEKLRDFLNNRYDWKIYYAEVNASDQLCIEKYIFEEYTPDFNNNEPSLEDEPIECNLPPLVM